MRRILHIKSSTADALADEVIAAQLPDTSLQIRIVDLNVDEPDYLSVLEEIFEADSVEVW